MLEGFDGIDRLSQDVGCRGIVHTLDELEEDDLTLIVGEAADGLDHSVLRQCMFDGHFYIDDVGYGLVSQFERLAVLATAAVVGDEIAGDGIEPGEQRAPAIGETVDLFHQAYRSPYYHRSAPIR